MFDNLENLTRLVAVVDHGTLHKAAEHLGLTQPAITRSIKLLERSAAAPLFDRHGRGVHLTPLGERVTEHARSILRECAFARTDVATLRDGESGHLNIAGAPVWMSSILPGAVAQMQRAYPRLTLAMRSLSYTEAIPLLHSGEIDIFCGGFQRQEGLSSFLVRTPIFTSSLTVVARKTHPIHALPGIGAQDLLDCSWLSYQSDVAYLDMIMEMIAAETGKKKQADLHCENMLTALELLRRGDYLSFLPSSFITSSFGAGISAVATQAAKASFQSGMIYRRSLSGSAPFTLLCDLADRQIRALGFHKEA
ncbi:LysR family transcriptional regulator [Rhodophyticola sp. CCM32]|uniref:LysR family transcriptional regulator n=1 Tax=Rhodophyticola sp. CCM32 TaxID=2916397 RepID=UPI00107F61BC|nr:LysR family transcriptional regulator [Rhodophyticola sp. CCM32]QBY00807.1 LysR family transcriptional regulator [Rhodophyticola sp. CCM32]